MATKVQGAYAPDGAKYATLSDGAGSLVPYTTGALGTAKQVVGSAKAPDGSIYFVLTNGNGTTV